MDQVDLIKHFSYQIEYLIYHKHGGKMKKVKS